jgi:hypothetical protein
MATAAVAREQQTEFDWRTAGAVEILPLIPSIRENRFGIDPPPGHDFVLRLNKRDYFVKFPLIRSGIIFSPSIDRAHRCGHLVEAATYAKFISECLPLSSATTIFVEIAKRGKQ